MGACGSKSQQQQAGGYTVLAAEEPATGRKPSEQDSELGQAGNTVSVSSHNQGAALFNGALALRLPTRGIIAPAAVAPGSRLSARRRPFSVDGRSKLSSFVIALGDRVVVYTCCYAPKGEWLAYGTNDGRCNVVQAETWSAVKSIKSTAAVLVCTFSPSVDKLSYGTKDGKCCTVSTRTWNVINTIAQTGMGYVWSCVYSPTGEEMTFGTSSGRCTTISTINWRVVNKIEGEDAIWACVYSPTGEQLTYGTADDERKNTGKCTTWSTSPWSRLHTIKATSSVYCCAYSPSGEQLMYGTDDGNCTIVSTSNWEIIHSIDAGSLVSTCSYSPRGDYVTYGTHGGRCAAVSAITWEPLFYVETGAAVWSCTFARNREHLTYGTDDGRCSTVDMRTWEVLHSSEHGAAVYCCCFAKSGSQMAYGSADGACVMVNVDTWEEVHPSRPRARAWVWAMTYSPDGGRLTYCTKSGKCVTLSTSTGQQIHTADLGRSPQQVWALCCAYSPNGKYLIIGSDDGRCTIVSTSSWKALHVIKGTAGVYCVAYAPQGEEFVYGTRDGKCIVVLSKSWETKREIVAEGWVLACVYAPNGSQVAYGTDGGMLTVVDTADLPASRTVHAVDVGSSILVCVYSPSGSQLTYGTRDGRCTTLSTNTWETLHNIEAGSQVWACAYSATGEYLLYGTNSGHLSVISTEGSPFGVNLIDVTKGDISTILDHVTLFPMRLCAATREIVRAKAFDKLRQLCSKRLEAAYFEVDGVTGLELLIEQRDREGFEDIFIRSALQAMRPVGSLAPFLVQALRVMPDLVVQTLGRNLRELARYRADVLDPVQRSSPDPSPFLTWQKERIVKGGLAAVARRTFCAGLGSKVVLKAILEAADATDSREVFGKPHLKLIVDELWQEISYLFHARVLTYLLFMFCTSVEAADIGEGYRTHYEVLLVAMGSVLLALHVVDATINMAQHFTSVWSLLELFLLGMVALTVVLKREFFGPSPLEGVDTAFSRAWASIMVLVAYFNALPYLRGFQTMAPLIRMLEAICWDIWPFLGVMALLLSGFSLAFTILFAEGGQLATFPNAATKVFLWAMVGDNDISFLEGQDMQWFDIIVYVVLELCIFVVCMNLLIAILGSSHEKVMDAFEVSFRYERAKLVLRQLHLLSYVDPSRLARLERHCTYFHTLVPQSLDALAEDSAAGSIQALRRDVGDAVSALEKRLDLRVSELQSTVQLLQADTRFSAAKVDRILSMLEAGSHSFGQPTSTSQASHAAKSFAEEKELHTTKTRLGSTELGTEKTKGSLAGSASSGPVTPGASPHTGKSTPAFVGTMSQKSLASADGDGLQQQESRRTAQSSRTARIRSKIGAMNVLASGGGGGGGAAGHD